jgi:gas vesicle structural protein
MEERDVHLRSPSADGGLIDVLDRVLDKGIVIDAWAKVSVIGIDLIGWEMNCVVASIETYLLYADSLGLSAKRTH